MGVIDWIILAVILFTMIMGWLKGFTTSLIYLGAWVFNFYFLGQLYPLLANTIRTKYNLPPLISNIVAIFFVVILIVVLAKIVITLLDVLIKALKLSTINRFFGLLLGLLNGALIIIVMMVLIDHVPRLANSLNDPQKHKVYARVHSYKDGIFDRLKLTQHEKYLQLKERFKLGKAKKEDSGKS